MIQYCIRNLAPPLMNGTKDEAKWFCTLELLRRMVTVLFIVALPWNEVGCPMYVFIFSAVYILILRVQCLV